MEGQTMADDFETWLAGFKRHAKTLRQAIEVGQEYPDLMATAANKPGMGGEPRAPRKPRAHRATTGTRQRRQRGQNAGPAETAAAQ
jgi:hypothetical protein